MRHFILETIKAETPLAGLFNAYMKGLSTVEIFSTPRESMRLCRELFTAAPLAKGRRKADAEPAALSIVSQAQRYYELTVLSNALNALHGHVQGAVDLLATFLTDYSCDLLAYAAANRRHRLNEYGGGEDADWEWNGTGNPDAGEGWEVTDTTDPARLAAYSLHGELARFFPDPESHGEYIGTSGPDDFARYTASVANQTAYCIRKMFAAVAHVEIPIYREDENGQFVPIPVIDQIERELNEDVANEDLAAHFNAVLNAGQHLATLYATMPPDELRGYVLLLGRLKMLLDGEVSAHPPF